ncbi:carboxypeptidase-like regulatory domain-containing protein [Polaribacter sp.]|uniref:carboxypeptidase-like regulatory domain-containing protein n=1 Tax=Polaribacter sp. TaxID=1920175 RepID=UPI003F6C78A0
MKTTKSITSKHSKLFFLVLFFSLFLVSSSANAQKKIKGIVKGQTEINKEALNGANIYLKGTTIGTSTNKKGEFTFPKTLKVGDILVFTYLGFVKKSIKIKENTRTLNVTLLEDSNQMLGALNSNKRYKSKRNKPTN